MHWWRMSLAIFVQLLGIATAAVHRGLRDTPNQAGNEAVCETQACKVAAARIVMDMDITVNPCDDFYKFTCGTYLQRNLPSGAVQMSARNTARTQLKQILRRLFDADYEVGELRVVKLAKTLYKTCMNEGVIETKGLRPLKNFVEMLGGWPVVEGVSWNESSFHWMATTAAWNRVGFPPVTFMDISIDIDSSDLTKHVLFISPPTWILKSFDMEIGFNGSVAIRVYYRMMVDVAVNLGADREKAEVELKEALLFQIELSNTIVAGKSENVRLTLKKLIEDYPRVDWRNTFARMYSPSQTIRDDDAVIVASPLFINNVIDLVSRTPKRVLANFAMFQIISLTMRSLNKETVEKLDTYEVARDGYIGKDPRWIFCANTVIEGIPTGVAHIYAKQFLKPETRVKFEDIIRNIREEFRTNIDKIAYLDMPTSTAAKQKESTIETVVGYPNQLLDNNELEKYYEDLDFYDDNLLNMFFLRKFDYDREVKDFRKPPNYTNTTEHYRKLFTRIAFATRMWNRISFSFNTLQGDLFNTEIPDYMNFGTAGTTIGHEMTHLFDNEGRLYIGNGVNNGFGLFTVRANRYFTGQLTCFQNQYGNYTDVTTNRNVDGMTTLNENISDNSAVKRAYHAYVKAMSGKAPEKRLSGLNYTPTQMYWIAYGNKNCEKKAPSHSSLMANMDPHAPSRFRVIGPLSNSPEFANDFSCPLGSKMNPVKKCSIW